MTCSSCEIMLERKLRKVPGVLSAEVDHKTGIAMIIADANALPDGERIESVIYDAGYRLEGSAAGDAEPPHRKWMEIGACLLILFALFKILQAFNIVSFVSSTAGAATFGGIFLIGLVAGTSSCLAVTGGLLLSMAAKYNETHQTETKWQKFKPLLSFNIGRLVSYFIFGGLVGVIGHSITLTPRMTGYMNIVVALVMLTLALSILKIFPKWKLGIRPPKALSHWIASLTESHHPAAPFALGAGTFFLPCGFTQSLQLVALASGSFLTGSLTMFVFALGTLPTLLGISAISSTAKGGFSRLFLRFSGALVLLLALFNLQSGLLLTGVDASEVLSSAFQGSAPVAYAGNDPNVTQNPDGSQTISMRVTAYGYEPSSFTIEGGKPTTVRATADSGISGCTSVLTAPDFGLTKYLRPGENQLGPFNPTQNFLLTCAMGMVRANVKVASADTGGAAFPAAATAPTAPIPTNAQVADLTWTSSGYSPRVLEVKQGQSTAVNVSATARTGGCMSTIVFPNFDQSAFVPPPGAAPVTVMLATESAEPGDYPITCGMGIRMGTLRITPG